MSVLLIDQAECVQGLRMIGFERQCPIQGGRGGFPVTFGLQHGTKVYWADHGLSSREFPW